MKKEKLKGLIINIGFPAFIENGLLRFLSKCKVCCDGMYYPQYGVAPHCHDKQLRSYLLPEKEWPENYDDVDNGCGVYYCPVKKCYYSKKNSLARYKEWETRRGEVWKQYL